MTLPKYAQHLRDLARAANEACKPYSGSMPVHPEAPVLITAFLSASREGVEKLCEDLEAALEKIEEYRRREEDQAYEMRTRE